MAPDVASGFTPEVLQVLSSLVDAILWPSLGVGLAFGAVIGVFAGLFLSDWLDARADRIAYERQFQE